MLEKQNVKNLQQKLKDLHFLNGYVDGDYGMQTKQALQDFQEQNDLTPDGIFGNGSSQFIESHCNNLDEKIIPDEEDEQNQNDDDNGNNENNEQEEQAPPEETTLWGEIWNGISNWWHNLFGGSGNNESGNEEQQNGEENGGDIIQGQNEQDECYIANNLSREGIEFIALHEGFVDHVYLDAVGKETIGFGHLVKPGENFPEKISREEALGLFKNDLSIFIENLNKNITNCTNQYEFDAMVSLSYNIGIGTNGFNGSTVLREHNLSHKEKAGNAFLSWNKGRINGHLQVLPGLTKRRKDERNLYLNKSYENN